MKRTFSASLPPPKKSSLQLPVSCQLCRTRKLKCDREHPCSNCFSRNVACTYTPGARQSTPPQAAIGGASNYGQSSEQHHESLIRRVQRLEEAVFHIDVPQTEDSRTPITQLGANVSSNSGHRSNRDEEQQHASRWLEGMVVTPDSAAVPNDPESPSIANETGRYMVFDSLAPLDIAQILDHLPTQLVAQDLFKRFTRNIDSLYRILHVPTSWSRVEDMYRDLTAGQVPTKTRLAFALSIFAASAHLARRRQEKKLMTLNGSPKALCEMWFRHAVFLLTKPPVPASTEALQAQLIVSYLSMDLSGLSGPFHSFLLSGVRMAQEMRIHRLDTPREREERQRNGADLVDIETKRRLWWHIVSSDWLIASMGGPQEGTYMLHPQQMETRHPSNVDDASIPTGKTRLSDDDYNLPLSTPTSMSYFIFRIKAATLSREVVDRLPPSYFSCPGADASDEIYDKILLLDRNYHAFLKSLPAFFRLDSHQNDSRVFREKPYLDWQRPLINFTIYTHITRLHRPFLIRGSSEPKFAYSRMQCIRSAEMVLDIRRNRMAGRADITKFYYIQHHVLMAAVVLAMDVCFNPEELKVEERKADVLRACQLLEENGRTNTSAGGACDESEQNMSKGVQKAVRSLRDMLNRYKERQQPGDSGSGNMAQLEMETSRTTHVALRRHAHHESEGQRTSFEEAQVPQEDPIRIHHQPFDEIWSDFFSVAPSFDVPDWAELFADLDSQLDATG